LIIAAGVGSIEIAKSLIEAGASLEIQNQLGDTALHDATRNGRTDIAKLLIVAEAPLEIQNNFGNTPLLFAATIFNTEIT
jgi:uncharacterized protein